MEKGMRLCGGTFFTLLLEMKKKKGVTNPDCLKSLVNIFYKSSDYFGKSTFSSNTSQYKTCDLSYSDWLQFDVKENVEEFSAKITNPQSYQEILLKMEDIVIKKLIDDKDKMAWVVQALLELIFMDDSIKDDAVFFIRKDGRCVRKSALLSLKNEEIYFPSFMLGMWHFIIENVPDNTIGKPTINRWYGDRDKHTVGRVPKSIVEGRFSSITVRGPINNQVKEAEIKESSTEETEKQKEKKLTPLEERILASGQAMADVLIPVLRNTEYGFEKRVLYSSSVLTNEEEMKYRSDESASMDVKEYYDSNNKKLIYRYAGSAKFTRRVDDFMNQNVVIAASFGDYSIESYTTYDNWKSKSYANNVLSEEDYECKIWFKIISTNDELVSRVQIILIEEL